MFRNIALALVALVASACAASSPTAMATTPVSVSVKKFSCAVGAPIEIDGIRTYNSKSGTLTRVGDVVLTALHVIENCNSPIEAFAFEEHDLAIIQTGDLRACRAPAEGERLVFHGYPGTEYNGSTKRHPVRLERHGGNVREVREDGLVIKSNGIPYEIKDHTWVNAPFLRGGYSGGAVTSAETGEFLGVISTGSIPLSSGSFIPADVICERMETLP